jgi:hypothetical protein
MYSRSPLPVLLDGGLRAVLEHGYLACGRQRTLLRHLFAEEGVEKGALAGVVLADDDEQEGISHVGERPAQEFNVAGWRAEPGEEFYKALDQGTLSCGQRLLTLVEDLHALRSSLLHKPGSRGLPIPCLTLSTQHGNYFKGRKGVYGRGGCRGNGLVHPLHGALELTSSRRRTTSCPNTDPSCCYHECGLN